MTYKQAYNYLCKKYPGDKRKLYLMPSSQIWAIYYRVKRRDNGVKPNNRSTNTV